MRFTALLFVLLMAFAIIPNTAVAQDPPATTAPITIFELVTIPLEELDADPVAYDGTVAYRKISVTGTLSELSSNRGKITQDPYSLEIDTTEEQLFVGFKVGDEIKLTGVFYHQQIGENLFIPNYVLHHPVEDPVDVEISEVLQDQESFNGKKISIIGNLSIIGESMGRYVLYVADPETNDEMKCMFYGVSDLQPGTIIEVSGLYNGGTLHSEDMGRYYPPMSLKTIIPGFSGFAALAVFGILAILFKRENHNG